MKIFKKLIAAMVAASILTGCCGCSDTPAQDSTSSAQTATTTSVATTSDTSATTTEGSSQQSTSTAQTESSQDIPVEVGGIYASYTIGSTWEEDGMNCSQLDFTVKNTSSSAVSAWSIEIDLGQNIEIMQSWNATLSAHGNTLHAANVEYNGSLETNAETTFGCIIKTHSPVSGGEVVGNSSGGQTPAQTTATTISTSAQPVEKPVIGEIDAQGLVSQHGQLSLDGADLVDEHGNRMQLRGVSTHGVQWFPQFVNKEAFKFMRDEWNINTIRLAMYSGESEGYNNSTKNGIEQTVQNAVDACIELDMYVIIDWHVLADQSPQVRKADALRFFGYMSEKYADFPNVIYEICNEPNGYASWQGDVKPYAEEVIPIIRANDPDSIIIVGTPTWSQDIDKALADPLKYDNIMYALHYYATTHTDWLRDRLKNCYNSGLAVFVSEFGNCDASGGGSNDFNQATKWLELLEELNISYMTWALSDKNETCSLLRPGAPTDGGWTDATLSDNGKFMWDWFLSH